MVLSDLQGLFELLFIPVALLVHPSDPVWCRDMYHLHEQQYQNRKITPKDLRVHLPTVSGKGEWIAHRTKQAFLQERLKHAWRMKVATMTDIESKNYKLEMLTDGEKHEKIATWAERAAKETFEHTKKQRDKFRWLVAELRGRFSWDLFVLGFSFSSAKVSPMFISILVSTSLRRLPTASLNATLVTTLMKFVTSIHYPFIAQKHHHTRKRPT